MSRKSIGGLASGELASLFGPIIVISTRFCQDLDKFAKQVKK
jgi:hypothetical protein